MRLSASFAVFRADPAEQDLARARWLTREGKTEAAEREYRTALAAHPDMAGGWIELVELLRRDNRHEAALEVAMGAEAHFGPDAAMPLVLKGAALSELGRTREAVKALEAALERDGNLALAWHELAYAAFKVGEFSRSLLALDRAFALEPHIDTLLLRGRILREAGQYEAAEVAFDAAQQATDHDIPKRDAEREGLTTRRAAALGGKRPAAFTMRERVFVETGTAVIDAGKPDAGLTAELLSGCLAALPDLVGGAGWKPAVVASAAGVDGVLAQAVAKALGVSTAMIAAIDPVDRPLIVTLLNDGNAEWTKQAKRLSRWSAGTTFALVQQPGVTDPADIAGAIRAVPADEVRAFAGAALAIPRSEPADVAETARLAANPQAPWCRRSAGQQPE
jgi:tetratricopeptide (TPR) repeat protein